MDREPCLPRQIKVLSDPDALCLGGSLPTLPRLTDKSLLQRSLELGGKSSLSVLTNRDSREKLQVYIKDASCGSFLSLHHPEKEQEEEGEVQGDNGCTVDQWLKTVVIYINFFQVGLVNGSMGPTLLELKSIANTTTGNAALLFTWGAIGRVPGSLTTAFTFERFPPTILLAISVLLTGFSTSLIPWCQQYFLMAIVFVFQGFGIGSTGGGCTSFCLKLWASKAAPFLQALTFTAALGNTCAPLIARPFLLATTPNINSTFAIDSSNTTNFNNSTIASGQTNRISMLYLIISTLQMVSSMLFVILFIKDRYTSSSDVKTVSREHAVYKENQRDSRSYGLCILFGLFMFCSAGLEVTFGGLIYAYTVDHLKWTEGSSAYLTFAYWMCIACGRGIGVILVRSLSPRTILIGDLAGSCVALSLMISLTGRHVAVEWTCACILGISLSTVVATTLNLSYSYVQLSSQLASVFMCCNYAGIMVLPALAGFLFRIIHGRCFVLVCFLTAVILVVIFSAIEVLHKCTKGYKSKNCVQTETMKDAHDFVA